MHVIAYTSSLARAAGAAPQLHCCRSCPRSTTPRRHHRVLPEARTAPGKVVACHSFSALAVHADLGRTVGDEGTSTRQICRRQPDEEQLRGAFDGRTQSVWATHGTGIWIGVGVNRGANGWLLTTAVALDPHLSCSIYMVTQNDWPSKINFFLYMARTASNWCLKVLATPYRSKYQQDEFPMSCCGIFCIVFMIIWCIWERNQVFELVYMNVNYSINLIYLIDNWGWYIHGLLMK
jgi:hypothetical protein